MVPLNMDQVGSIRMLSLRLKQITLTVTLSEHISSGPVSVHKIKFLLNLSSRTFQLYHVNLKVLK
jgi:hypothetical protein